jgi:hypothetical protein
MACGVLVFANIATPWSEDVPGKSFSDWWRSAFGSYDDWPPELPWHGLELQQQHEWVTCRTYRAGSDALRKPLKALSAAGRERVFNEQERGAGGQFKLVLRQVPVEYADDELRFTQDGKKVFGILRLLSGMQPMEVSRDDPYRSRVESMPRQFLESADYDKVRQRLESLLQEALARQDRSMPKHPRLERNRELWNAMALLDESGRDAKPAGVPVQLIAPRPGCQALAGSFLGPVMLWTVAVPVPRGSGSHSG